MPTTNTLHPRIRLLLKIAKVLVIALFALAVVIIWTVIRCGTIPDPNRRRTVFWAVTFPRRRH